MEEAVTDSILKSSGHPNIHQFPNQIHNEIHDF
jgi:hypothetical protein